MWGAEGCPEGLRAVTLLCLGLDRGPAMLRISPDPQGLQPEA